MLLTCKAIAEGSRSMMYETAMLADYMLKAETPEEHKKVDEEMGFLTPILKGRCARLLLREAEATAHLSLALHDI